MHLTLLQLLLPDCHLNLFNIHSLSGPSKVSQPHRPGFTLLTLPWRVYDYPLLVKFGIPEMLVRMLQPPRSAEGPPALPHFTAAFFAESGFQAPPERKAMVQVSILNSQAKR